MLHERKLESSHEELMKFLHVKLPSTSTGKKQVNIPIVTDEEKSICNVIDKWLKGIIRLRCWNHIFSAACYWLKKHGATNTEIPFYLEDISVFLISRVQHILR